MAIESRIARRYLWAARQERHTAFLAGISILGLAVGVAALLISIALLTGLQTQIKNRLIESSPQLLIEPAGGNTIAGGAEIVAAAQKLGVPDVRPIVSGIGWGGTQDQQQGRPVRIRSFTPQREPKAEATRGSTASAADGESEIFITRDYAASLGLTAGDQLTIVAPRTRLTPFGPVPVIRTYRITRILPVTLEENAADAWLPMEEASALFGTGGEPTSIEMYGIAERAEELQGTLSKPFPGVQVKTWKEINRPLFLALRLEKIVMFATISLIIFVAALNLISSLSMLIMRKRPAVGVLRTLGATEKTILSIFLRVGLLIGITGTILGNVIGIGFSWAANRFHLIPPPGDIFISYLPFLLDVEDVVGVNVIAVTLSILATWYPARIASRLNPIAAIHEE